MQTYRFKWRRLRRLFWRTEKGLIGHRLDKEQNKMVLTFSDGSLKEVQEWMSCQVSLGVDWVLFVKNLMEKEAGQNLKLNVDTDKKA